MLWSPRFAAVYFLAAVALFALYINIDASLAIVAPMVLVLVGLGVAVLVRNRASDPEQ